MVAIHFLAAILLSTTALKVLAEPTDDGSEIALRDMVDELLQRELGSDYADFVEREPLLSSIAGFVKTGVRYASKAASLAGKAVDTLQSQGGAGGVSPADQPLTQDEINKNKNFKSPIKFEAPKQRKQKKQKRPKQKKSKKGKREFLDEEYDVDVFQRGFEELVERAFLDAADAVEQRDFGFGEDGEEILMRAASLLEGLD